MRVGLSELPSSVLNEVEAYPWNRLLSDIGGSAGLLLGISAFTIYLQIEGTAFLEYCTLVRAFLGHALSGHNALSGHIFSIQKCPDKAGTSVFVYVNLLLATVLSRCYWVAGLLARGIFPIVGKISRLWSWDTFRMVHFLVQNRKDSHSRSIQINSFKNNSDLHRMGSVRSLFTHARLLDDLVFHSRLNQPRLDEHNTP